MLQAVWALVWTAGTYYVTRGVNVARLTDRQCEIVALIADGADTEEICERLGLSTMIVRRQIRKITLKLTGGEQQGGLMPDLPVLAERLGACVEEEAA